MKFGDIIVDGRSDLGRPHRAGIFVRKLSTNYVRLTDAETGELWDAPVDGNHDPVAGRHAGERVLVLPAGRADPVIGGPGRAGRALALDGRRQTPHLAPDGRLVGAIPSRCSEAVRRLLEGLHPQCAVGEAVGSESGSGAPPPSMLDAASSGMPSFCDSSAASVPSGSSSSLFSPS